MIRLELFVSGAAPGSRLAKRHARRVADAVQGDCELRVVDVDQDPEAAELVGVLATPLLLRHRDGGTVRVIGDLSETSKILDILGLPHRLEVS